MRGFFIAVVAAAVATFGVSQGAFAADSHPTLVKAAAPATGSPGWTGFYFGLTLGYGWGDRTITATGNDPISTGVLTGTIGQPGEQPVGPVSFRDKGAFGGIEAGYNWQIGRNYVAGIEADFNGSDIRGQGATTSVLSTLNPTLQQLSANQQILWFGTVRPRLGWLATDNLLLYGTGGVAYGRVHDTVNFGLNGVFLGFFIPGGAGFVNCAGFANCIYGQSDRVAVGWTAGAGAELQLPGGNARVKVEYLFVDLGSGGAVTATALATAAVSTKLSSFSAAFSSTDFSTVRVGLNWAF